MMIESVEDRNGSHYVVPLVKDAMDAGASGVVFGRNIWKHPNIEGISRAISKIVHENAEVEKAMEELK